MGPFVSANGIDEASLKSLNGIWDSCLLGNSEWKENKSPWHSEKVYSDELLSFIGGTSWENQFKSLWQILSHVTKHSWIGFLRLFHGFDDITIISTLLFFLFHCTVPGCIVKNGSFCEVQNMELTLNHVFPTKSKESFSRNNQTLFPLSSFWNWIIS